MSDSPTPTHLRERLDRIASNLAYGWRHELRTPFVLLDEAAFDRASHNPRRMLRDIADDAIAAVANDGAFLEALDRAESALGQEVDGEGWWAAANGQQNPDLRIAYFSAEFGVDESLPIYSGGLGVLAGDHLKAASEMDIPLVGVGLLYKYGYFRQIIDEFGSQQERYPVNDPDRLAVERVVGADGRPAYVEVDLAGETVRAAIWRAHVGRVQLYLLDSYVDGNSPWARRVTDSLYGGDREQRIRQEILLGVGGVRLLREVGCEPTVWHLNEGHAAFLQFERLRELTQAGTSYDDALAHIRQSTVFTTHTPVPAGNEVFDPELVRRYLGGLIDEIGAGWEQIEALGASESWGFGMTPFSLRTSARANGVAKLHGEVSREMWTGLGTDGVAPIGHVTNGVHARTWFSQELAELLGRYGVNPGAAPGEQHWERVRDVPDAELWELHNHRKRYLIETAERRLARQAAKPEHLALDPNALTIGFARRFATYKRAGLFFSDPERLARLIGDPERPVQILLAGKAHPADRGGKDLIAQVVAYSRDPNSAGRIAFLEDYEMVLARRLVQGVDVWLNTPRRPMEASGTSGMKAALNGVLNCSISDGWWAEGQSPEVGFTIGTEQEAAYDAVQDAADAESLYATLEQQVLPTFFGRGADGVPHRWVSMMKESIATLGPAFNTTRMVDEYVTNFYIPSVQVGIGQSRTSG